LGEFLAGALDDMERPRLAHGKLGDEDAFARGIGGDEYLALSRRILSKDLLGQLGET
jgi:hypothetical protein